MKRSRKVPARRAPPGEPLNVLDRLDAALVQRQGGSNAELIRRLYEVMFGEADEPERPGTNRPPEVSEIPNPDAP